MTKRITSLQANWAFILENLLPRDSKKAVPVKMIAEKYTREISAKPAELPELNWESYKSRMAKTDKINALQKAYESFKIPYPSDQGALAEMEKMNAQMLKNAQTIAEDMEKHLKKEEAELQRLESIINYSEMTMEEYYMANPKHRLDPEKPEVDPWPQMLIKEYLLERMLARGTDPYGKPFTEEEKKALEFRLKVKDF